MLEKVRKLLKNKEQVIDTVNVLLGLLMITALVVFWKTGNKVSMCLIIFSGGMMNVSNGYRFVMQKDRKNNMGYSMMFFGVVILVLGVGVMLL